MTVEALADLRERLAAMREDLVGRLIARIDGGEMALLGSVGETIAAVDAMRGEGAGIVAMEATRPRVSSEAHFSE